MQVMLRCSNASSATLRIHVPLRLRVICAPTGGGLLLIPNMACDVIVIEKFLHAWLLFVHHLDMIFSMDIDIQHRVGASTWQLLLSLRT
jgi:hypothetical protein